MIHASERFERKVERVPFSGCWIWMGAARDARLKWPYGSFYLDGSLDMAHRASWRLFRGAIPKGQLVCHACDVAQCVNPDHLFLGTPKANMQDMMAKRRDVNGRIVRRGKVSKLTEADVRTIRASSLSYGRLAKVFGVGRATIQHVKEGRTWRHVK